MKKPYLVLFLVFSIYLFSTNLIAQTQEEALIAFYNATDGDNWTNNTNWLSNEPLGDWFGIDTDVDGNVIQIFLGYNNLVGNIPSELGNLSNLQDLTLSDNQLSGNIPSELGSLSYLQYLHLSENQLSGSIPFELGNLLNLQYLYLGNNQLTGPIPNEFGNLSNLQDFKLQNNLLIGSIPSDLGSLSNLQHLNLSVNQFSGSIPPEIGNLLNLVELNLSNNQLNGSIPIGIWNIENLASLSLGNNQFSGSIPPEIGNLINLTFLELSANQLSGDIPSEIGNLVNLALLELHENQLNGNIPPEIGNLVNLINLTLFTNQLSGNIPSEIGNLVNLNYLHLSYNQLSGSIPVEIGNLTNLEVLDLSVNGFHGEIPSEIASLLNLQYLSFYNNNFDILPTEFQNMTPLSFSIPLNQFTFEDIQNMPSVGTYNPQNTIHAYDTSYLESGIEGVISLSFDENVLNSTYIWKKDGNQIAVSDSNSFLRTESTVGTYYYTVEITNSLYTGFILNVDSVVVIVDERSCSDIEREALIALYNATDGDNWTDNTNWLSDESVGNWYGVTINGDGCVINLDLFGNSLAGTIPQDIGDLSNLQYLNLNENQLSGSIPSEFGGLSSLGQLHLSSNQLTGSIPPELGNLSNLIYLGLNTNQLTGSIPISLGGLTNLADLILNDNQLSGSIPSELGNLSNLQYLLLNENQFTGSIPSELGNLTGLVDLRLFNNQLSGSIPLELGNLLNLQVLYLNNNQLSGSVPTELGNIPNLAILELSNNQLESPLPTSICTGSVDLMEVSLQGNLFTAEDCSVIQCISDRNILTFNHSPQSNGFDFNTDCVSCTESDSLALVALYNSTDGNNWNNNTNWLTGPISTWYGLTINSDGCVINLDLFGNNLVGTIHQDIGDLSSLEELNLGWNDLTSIIPPEISNLLNLEILKLMGNDLTGIIPSEFGNLINLEQLYLNNNQLTGIIPPELGSLTSLILLSSGVNQHTGSIPPELGSLINLGNLWLNNNQITGIIPPEFGNLTNLSVLSLEENQLIGIIPSELSNLSNLSELRLHNNQLSGSIPSELGNLLGLVKLYLSNNQLTGNIPPELGNLINLVPLSLDNNQLTGNIPPELGNLVSLVYLNLEENQLTGSIPSELGSLSNLLNLVLNNNDLSGSIPTELESLLNLEILALSDNQLTGAIPYAVGTLVNIQWLTLNNNQFESPLPSSLCSGMPNLTNIFLQNNLLGSQDCDVIQCLIGGVDNIQHSPQSNGFDFNTDCVNCIEQDSLALVALYNSTDGDNWTDNTNWLTGPVGTWYGISLDMGGCNVISINLSSNNLVGNISSDLGSLSELQDLNLSVNQLSGSIPNELGNLLNLQSLFLYENQLSGSIPTELGNLSSLGTLLLMINQLTGNIPPELGNLSNLSYLGLNANQLSGSIPSELGNLSNLQQFSLSENQLTGSIPSELGNLSNLHIIYLGNNLLTGSIPSELGNLSNLQNLELGSNQLTGSIPSEFINLSDLQVLYLNNNQLESPTPQGICTGLINLMEVSLQGNLFTAEDCSVIQCIIDRNLFYFSHSPQSNGFNFDTDCSLAISFTEITTDVLCFGDETGVIELIATEGNPPYEYSINGGVNYQTSNIFSELNAGIYSVFVRDDNGLLASHNVTISEPDAELSFVETTTDILCFGGGTGIIEIIAIGGTGAYEYSINDGVNYQTSNIFTGQTAGTYPVMVKDANDCIANHNVIISEPGAALSFIETATDVLCFGGSTGIIEITATGGTTAYEYSKDDGVSYQASNIFMGLTAGTYPVMVKDANDCIANHNVAISEPDAALSFTETAIDVFCFGETTGAIEITATGGTAAYEYSIDNGVNYQVSNIFMGLTAGTYPIIVKDANNCIANHNVDISEPDAALSFTETAIDVFCFGETTGAIEITATGGTAAYVYSIDNGVNYQVSNIFMGLTAGTYPIIVKDANNCIANHNVDISEPDAALSFIEITTDVLCFGESTGVIEITATGGTTAYEYSKDDGVSYQASNIFTGLSMGTYPVMVKDANDCIAYHDVIISEPDAALSFIEITTDVLCFGESTGVIEITATGGTTACEYSKDDGVSYQASNIFTGLTSGTYPVMVKDANDCIATQGVTINEPDSELSFVETITDVICFGEATGTIDITVTGGTSTYEYSIDGGSNYFNSNLFTDLLAGEYEINVKDANNCITSHSAIIEQPESLPNVNFIGLDDSYCENSSTITLIGSQQPEGIFTGSGITDNGDGSAEFEPTSSGVGSHNITYTYTDGDNCTTIGQQTVIINALPSLDINPLYAHYCVNDPIIHIIGSEAPYGIFSINPTHNGFTDNGDGTADLDPAEASSDISFQIEYIFTDANSCTGSIIKSTEIHPVLNPDVVGNISPCQNSEVIYETYQDMGDYLWTVSEGGIVTSGGTTSDHTITIYWETAGEQTIEVDFDYFGCGGPPSPLEITVGAIPITVNVTDVFCFGGSTGIIEITATGGTADYEYSIDDGVNYQASNIFTGLTAGTYPVVVRDANDCIANHDVIISEPDAALSFIETTTDVLCKEELTGKIVITANGGAPPYSYSINNGADFQSNNIFEGLSAGTYYIVTHDNNECYEYQQLEILEPEEFLSFDIISSNVNCFGGDDGYIEMSALGGTEPFEYSIDGGVNFQVSNIFDHLYAGEYELLLLDANLCESSQLIIIQEPSSGIEVFFSGLEDEYCNHIINIELIGNHMPNGWFTGEGVIDNGDGTAYFNPATAGEGT